MRSLRGSLLYGAEAALGVVWMLGELAVLATSPRDVLSDPHWDALIADIEQRGWYLPIDVQLELRDGWLRGAHPYARIGAGGPDNLLARFVPGRGSARARRLLVVHHCYGLPSPAVMERLFGLRELDDVDVAYGIANHHARGSYPVWPGSGFLRARPSHMLENIRSAVTGARAIVEWLARSREYQRVTVLGYSLGGQLALHVANSAPIDRAILYCPVVNGQRTARQLGLGMLERPLEWTVRRNQLDLAVHDHADPLRYPLRIPEHELHVIAQRHDAFTPVHHVREIHARYPKAGYHEHGGTHLYPSGLSAVRATIRTLA